MKKVKPKGGPATGTAAGRARTDRSWADTIKSALAEKRPPTGWPKPADTRHR